MELREALEAIKACCGEQAECSGCTAGLACIWKGCVPARWDVGMIAAAVEQLVKDDE